MKDRVNTYFAVLIIISTGAWATWLIIHIVYANSFSTTVGGSEANYSRLQQQILKQ